MLLRIFKYKRKVNNFPIQTFSQFQQIRKDPESAIRRSKLSIIEYFGLVDERGTAKQHEILVNELYNYMNSKYIDKEFKYLINDKETLFKFFIFHLSLLTYRLRNVQNSKLYY
jgi:hypothetical protein